MKKFLSHIAPFLLITLVTVAAVEGCYWQLKQYLAPQARQITQKRVDAGETVTPKATPTDHSGAHFKQVILDRQLFGKPEKALVTEQISPVPIKELNVTKQDIILMGTIDAASGNGRAIIMDKKSKTQQIYQTGDAINGAIIEKVSRGRVILSINGKNEFLEMNESMQYTPKVQSSTPQSSKPPQKPVKRATRTRKATSTQ